jgi:hypothetical protein
MNARSERMERRFRVPIIIAALLVIPVLILQSITIHGGALPAPWSILADVGNWVIWLTFLTETVAMLAVVSDRRAWLRGHVLDVAIVILTPPVAPAAIQSMRLLRLLRLVRLARFVPLILLGVHHRGGALRRASTRWRSFSPAPRRSPLSRTRRWAWACTGRSPR